MRKLNILAIGSHPDDIELGCGGTLMKAVRAGHDVYMYVLTRGGKSGNTKQRTNELVESASFMHAKRLWVDDFEDTDLTVGSRIINHIEYFVHKADPDIILTHPLRDYHHDHRAVAECTLEAARNSQNVFAYEIPLTMEFAPQLYCDISDVIQDKVKCDLFESQRGKSFTKGSSVRAMAECRATQGKLDTKVIHAEAFQVLKMCTDASFGLMKFARGTMPPSVLIDIVKSLTEILEFSPGEGLPEILKTANTLQSSIREEVLSELLL